MKRYLIVILSSVLLVAGLPALAKDHDGHGYSGHDKAKHSTHREHRRWDNRGHKQDRWAHKGHRYDRQDWKKSRHTKNFPHHSRSYYNERRYTRPHYSSYNRYYRGNNYSKHHSTYCKQHRRYHDRRNSHLIGGVVAGVLINEYLHGHRH